MAVLANGDGITYLEEPLNDELAVLFAKRFIQRRDVKAVQLSFRDKEIYSPDSQLRNPQTKQYDPGRYGPVGFEMKHLYQHLNCEATYGHYLLDADSNCRMFAFDIDLTKEGFFLPLIPFEDGMDPTAWEAMTSSPVAYNPREAWMTREPHSRGWAKTQMGVLARRLVSQIQKETGLPCAAAYSGSKGVHVYGFTGPLPAAQVRAAALYILESTDDWEPDRGQSIFKHKLQDPVLGYPNFTIEVFPKQDSLEGKDLGNLMRLPMGRNLKTDDPCFFLDLTTPAGVFQPHSNPVKLLETGEPYA
jgi:hypothetical protein